MTTRLDDNRLRGDLIDRPVPVHLIDTPHACYGAAWAPDGERLAVCGGFLYGQGFVHVLDADGRIYAGLTGAELVAEVKAPGPRGFNDEVILSSVCWDDAGSALLAAACGYKWHARPPILFGFDRDTGLRARPIVDDDDDDDDDDDAAPVNAYRTGCWLHRGRIVLRGPTTWLRDTLAVRADPAARGLHADEPRSSLQNARLTVIDDIVYTAKNQARVYTSDGSGLRQVVNPHGLAHLDLLAADATTGLTPHPPEQVVQALVRDRAGAHIFGGLNDRTIVRWRVLARGVVERDATWEHPRGATSGEGLVVRGVTALCCLADGHTLISADHAGAVHAWRDARLVATAQIPGGCSPRSLAAHPSELSVAVGCKSGRGGYHNGAVFRVDLR